jgi:2-dehydro-3-deoxygluconokinase
MAMTADRAGASDAAIDIVSIGEPMVEFNQTDSGAPRYLQGFGGDTSNMVIAAARSGARSAYVTRLGDDEFGRMFLGLWRSEGVDCSSVAVDPAAHTAVYFVTHGSQGHVFSYLRAGSAASLLSPANLPQAILARARVVHASGISQAISSSACDAVLQAFDAARAAGSKVAFDSNLRLKLWPLARARAMVTAAASLSDYFFPSLEDAATLSGLQDPQAILDWCHRSGARTVFLKLGADGVIVSDGDRREHLAGHPVDAVDATGAGDCFCGACLARIAAGDDIVTAARYANAAAALSTTGFGAVAPLPRPDAVAALLARAPQATRSR